MTFKLKVELQNNDTLIFKNNTKTTFNENQRWIIDQFYDENLNCKYDDDYSIVEVLKKSYQKIKVLRRYNEK